MNISRRTCLAIPALLLSASCANRMELSEVSTQIECTFETDIPRPMKGNYLLYLPESYDRSHNPWPLILFLHGSGQRGDNLQSVKKHGLPKIVEKKRDFPFVVISPQCPSGEEWSSEYLNELLDDIISHYRVDPDRVYLTGLSMGGYGVWDMATRYPEKFAAIAPVCGGGKPSLAQRLRHIPAWVFHGARDLEVPIAESEAMVEALKRTGGTVKFTIYPYAGHNCWTETYENPDLYTWFLRQRRHPASASGTVKSGSSRK